jgi:hypothetical protein
MRALSDDIQPVCRKISEPCKAHDRLRVEIKILRYNFGPHERFPFRWFESPACLADRSSIMRDAVVRGERFAAHLARRLRVCAARIVLLSGHQP